MRTAIQTKPTKTRLSSTSLTERRSGATSSITAASSTELRTTTAPSRSAYGQKTSTVRVGNTIERAVQFDDTIPRAENLNYSSSDYVSGDFNLTADILDDVQVKSVKISYNGGQDYVDLVTANTVEPASLR